MVDFFTDELDGDFVWNEGDADAFGWGDFFAAGFWAVSSRFIEVTAVVATLAAVVTAIIAAVVATAFIVFTARVGIAFFGFAKFLFRAGGFGTSPCWTKSKLVKKAFKGIVGSIAHGRKLLGRNEKDKQGFGHSGSFRLRMQDLEMTFGGALVDGKNTGSVAGELVGDSWLECLAD